MNVPAHTAAEARNIVLSILADFWEDGTDDEGVDRLFDYWQHVGFEVADLPQNPAPELICEAFVVHYTDGVGINVNRAIGDLSSWPPIVARIAEIGLEKLAEARKTKPRLPNEPNDLGLR
jgi:hypothetical protein